MIEIISEISVISFTKNGAELGRIISRALGAKAYAFYKYASDGDEEFDDADALVSRLFDESRALIFVGACAIAVRLAAPHIKSKAEDPAVIVADEKGRYVIPVLSGHLGGANALARITAKKIEAEAVITTATDINNKFAPDVFAMENNLAFSDFKAAKEISAAVLNEKRIGFASDFSEFTVPQGLCGDTECEYGICISERKKKPFLHTLNLYPKNLVLGIGCRKGAESIEEAAKKCAGDISRIYAVASIDKKKDEAAILNFCRANRIKFITFTAEELMDAAGDFTSSEFVKSVTGADNICERAVVSAGAELIKRKRIFNGVTAALGRLPGKIRNLEQK